MSIFVNVVNVKIGNLYCHYYVVHIRQIVRLSEDGMNIFNKFFNVQYR